jgi:hypothetical protein
VIYSDSFFSCLSPQFRHFFDRGDLPVSRNCGDEEGRLHWKETPDLLDNHHYLPLFLDCLREPNEPHWFFSYSGTVDPLQSDGNISGFGQSGSVNQRRVGFLLRTASAVYNEFFLTTFNLGDRPNAVNGRKSICQI